MRYVLALDQGTTSSRAILFDEKGTPKTVAQREFQQIFPQPGWVEHDAKEILATQRAVAREAVRTADIPLQVVWEDEHLAVIDKPAGLVVHPAPGHWDDTLVNALVARGTNLGGGVEGRPGIVHRLDRDTSGLIVVAKSDLAHRRLGAALAARKVSRRYAALAWGHLDDDPTIIEAPIDRHPKDRTRMAIVEDVSVNP